MSKLNLPDDIHDVMMILKMFQAIGNFMGNHGERLLSKEQGHRADVAMTDFVRVLEEIMLEEMPKLAKGLHEETRQ